MPTDPVIEFNEFGDLTTGIFYILYNFYFEKPIIQVKSK